MIISSVDNGESANKIVPHKGNITFVGLDPSMEVYVNGRRVSLKGIELELEYHKKFEIIVKRIEKTFLKD